MNKARQHIQGRRHPFFISALICSVPQPLNAVPQSSIPSSCSSLRRVLALLEIAKGSRVFTVAHYVRYDIAVCGIGEER